MGCTPKLLTPTILAFEFDARGAGSPSDSVGCGAKEVQARSKQKKFAILKGFGEKETQVPTWNLGCVQNSCCGGRVRDKKEMLLFYRSCNW